MEFVRYHLGRAIAFSRPELTPIERQLLLDQLIERIDVKVEAAPPLGMIADVKARELVKRVRADEHFSQKESPLVAFAITCEPEGTIQQVIRDGLGFGPRFTSGTLLTAFVSPFQSRKAGRFLRDVRQKDALFDYPLTVLGPLGTVRLFWSGVSIKSFTIVIGTTAPLSFSIPEEVAQLAEGQPDTIKPFLVELATRRNKNISALQAAPDYGPETRAVHHRVSRRRRLLELAAHDLRNPISGILTACEYLIEDAARVLEPHHTVFLYSIASSSRHALKLIQDMTEIPHIRVATPTLDLQPVNIVSIVEQEAAALRPLANAMNVRMSLHTRGQMPAFRGDPARLAAALHGLIVNAIGSDAKEGKIEFDISGGPNEISVALHRAFLATPGAPGQAAVSGARKKPRTLSDVHAALLLAQARRIITAHGGVLRAEGHGKHGPSWTMTLPASAERTVSGQYEDSGMTQ